MLNAFYVGNAMMALSCWSRDIMKIAYPGAEAQTARSPYIVVGGRSVRKKRCSEVHYWECRHDVSKVFLSGSCTDQQAHMVQLNGHLAAACRLSPPGCSRGCCEIDMTTGMLDYASAHYSLSYTCFKPLSLADEHRQTVPTICLACFSHLSWRTNRRKLHRKITYLWLSSSQA